MEAPDPRRRVLPVAVHREMPHAHVSCNEGPGTLRLRPPVGLLEIPEGKTLRSFAIITTSPNDVAQCLT